MTLKKRSNDSDDALGTRRVKVNSLLFNLRRNYSNSLIHFFFQFIGISFWSWILKNHFQIQNLLHKTWNKTFSRHSCAVTTKRWQSVLHVQKLFLTSSSPSLLRGPFHFPPWGKRKGPRTNSDVWESGYLLRSFVFRVVEASAKLKWLVMNRKGPWEGYRRQAKRLPDLVSFSWHNFWSF